VCVRADRVRERECGSGPSFFVFLSRVLGKRAPFSLKHMNLASLSLWTGTLTRVGRSWCILSSGTSKSLVFSCFNVSKLLNVET